MYTKPVFCASAGNLGPRTHSCTTFAREAVFAEFRPRDARAIDYDYFKDREPAEPPRLSPVLWRRETNGPKRVELADLIDQEAA